jgi:hypothetical protein
VAKMRKEFDEAQTEFADVKKLFDERISKN